MEWLHLGLWVFVQNDNEIVNEISNKLNVDESTVAKVLSNTPNLDPPVKNVVMGIPEQRNK